MKKAGVVGVAAAVAGAALASPASAGATRRKTIVLDVDTDGFADFQQVDNGDGTGPFYVSGDVMAPGAGTSIGTKKIGTFHCWGWIRSPDALGVVTQEFDLDGRGKILVAGVESDAPRGVIGGTRQFKEARGQGFPDVEIFDFMNTGRFKITFRLTGARGPEIT